jgi:hypothetical protein
MSHIKGEIDAFRKTSGTWRAPRNSSSGNGPTHICDAILGGERIGLKRDRQGGATNCLILKINPFRYSGNDANRPDALPRKALRRSTVFRVPADSAERGEALPLRAKAATQGVENGRAGPLSDDQPCLRQIAAMHNFCLLNRGG